MRKREIGSVTNRFASNPFRFVQPLLFQNTDREQSLRKAIIRSLHQVLAQLFFSPVVPRLLVQHQRALELRRFVHRVVRLVPRRALTSTSYNEVCRRRHRPDSSRAHSSLPSRTTRASLLFASPPHSANLSCEWATAHRPSSP